MQNAKDEEIARCLEILGLADNASVEEIKLAYRDLMTVRQPDKYADNPRLLEKADEKIVEVVKAYNTLLTHKKEQESQTSQLDTEESVEKAASVIESGDAKTSIEPERAPDTLSVESSGNVKTEPISDKPLKYLFLIFGFAIGQGLAKFTNLTDPAGVFLVSATIVSICGAACWFIGGWLARIINEKDTPKQAKIRLAWIVAVSGFIVCFFIIVVSNGIKYETKNMQAGNSSNINATINELNKKIEENPKDAIVYLERGVKYFEIGNYSQAIADHNKAIELSPTEIKALIYYSRGKVHRKLGNLNEAIRDYDKSIEIDPKFDDAYRYRGFAYSDLDNSIKAIADYSKAIELCSGDCKLGSPEKKYECDKVAKDFFFRCDAYLQIGLYSMAIDDCSKTIEIDNKSAIAYFGRGTAYAANGNKELALEDYKKAAKLGYKFAQDDLKKRGITW